MEKSNFRACAMSALRIAVLRAASVTHARFDVSAADKGNT